MERESFSVFATLMKGKLKESVQQESELDKKLAEICLEFGLNFYSSLLVTGYLSDVEKQKMRKIWKDLFNSFVKESPRLKNITILVLLNNLVDSK